MQNEIYAGPGGFAMTWHEWYQDDLPCEFSSARANDNYSYLCHLLGSEFLCDNVASTTRNALLRTWNTTDASAFLQLNALAEDLRVLEGKPRLSCVLRDLCCDRLCLPTWHMIHTAAMFERARANAVFEFVEAGGDESPDFVVDINGDRVPVEAKLLTKSDDERRFISIAKRIDKALAGDNNVIPVQTAVYVILKEPVKNDISGEAIRFCLEAISRYGDTAVCERGSVCNVFLEPAPAPVGPSEYRLWYIMAPVPDSENMRVLVRAKKASNQLRSLASALDSGIVSVGLTDNQDGIAVFSHIANQVRRRRFGGISAFLLLKRGTHLGPPRRTMVDLLELRKNPNADHPLHGKVPLRPLAAAALLTQVEPHIGGIRAYRLGSASGRVVDPTKASVVLPDIRVLTADLMD